MERHQRLIIVGIAFLFSAVVLIAAYFLPLGRDVAWVFRLTAGQPQLVELTADSTITQTFGAQSGTYSGVAFFSANDKLTDQQLIIRLLDSEGQELAHTRNVDESYYLDKLRLQFSFRHVELIVGQRYLLAISLVSGQPIDLLAVENTAYSHDQLTAHSELLPTTDLALQLLKPASASFGARQGALAGIVFLWGVVLLQFIPPGKTRFQWLAASGLLLVCTPLALAGYWFSKEPLGINDWDYYFSLHHIWRQIIIDFHQLPFWNPYTCGGTAALADPEFSVLTPSFLFELIFGVPQGLRLAAYLSVAVGSIGMLHLAKRLGLSVTAGLVAALAAFFGSVNILEITEGHPNIFASMWIPWIFWAWLGAYRSLRNAIMPNYKLLITNYGLKTLPCGIFLALTFSQGGIYLLMYTLLAFLVLPWLTSRPWQAIKATFFAGIWALGLAGIKLVPVLLWLREFPDKAYASSAYTLPWLHEILLGRHLHGSTVIPEQGAGWHEYGAYVGYMVVGLSLVGLVKWRRRRTVRALAIAALLAILLSSAGPLLKPVFDQAPFLPRSMISRILFFGIIPLSLLAGFGLDTIRTRLRYGPVLAIILAGIVAVDVMSLSYQISEQAFVVPKGSAALEGSPYPLAFTGKTPEYKSENGETYTRAYLATRIGYGTLNYCSVLGPSSQVKIIEDESGADFVRVQNGRGIATLEAWQPNRIIVKAQLTEPAEVIINNNYAAGWHVNDGPATEIAGLVGVRLPDGGHELVFRYGVPGLIPGILLTCFTLASALWLHVRRHS